MLCASTSPIALAWALAIPASTDDVRFHVVLHILERALYYVVAVVCRILLRQVRVGKGVEGFGRELRQVFGEGWQLHYGVRECQSGHG